MDEKDLQDLVQIIGMYKNYEGSYRQMQSKLIENSGRKLFNLIEKLSAAYVEYALQNSAKYLFAYKNKLKTERNNNLFNSFF